MRLLAVLVVACLLLEGSVRLLLFSDLAAGWSLAQRLRKPSSLGVPECDDSYWCLNALWEGPEKRQLGFPYDATVGWTSRYFEPETYEHLREADIGRSRKVLLFGDSFSACMTPPKECFEGLLEASPLWPDYKLLNYGVVGHGLDQIALLVEAVLARHAADDPIVIVGLLVDNDLERTTLTYRDWPKPRFQVRDGALDLTGVPVPSVDEAMEKGLPGVTSWSLSLLRGMFTKKVGGKVPYPEATRVEMEEIARLLVRRIVADLEAHDVPFFFLLFHTWYGTQPDAHDGWRENALFEELAALDAPWVLVRDELRLAAEHQQRDLHSYFFPEDSRSRGHLDPEGNAIAFETILRGLLTYGGVPEEILDRPRPWIFEWVGPASSGENVDYQFKPSPYLPEGFDHDRLVIRPGPEHPTRVSYPLKEPLESFVARVWAWPPQDDTPELAMEVLVDGEPRWSRVLATGADPIPLEVDLRGARELAIVVHPPSRSAGQASLVLSDPRFVEVDGTR